jgi:hypothetical protein
MPRDVDARTLPADPTSVLHAAPKQYAEKAKVSSNDTTAGYLNGKLVAGDNITLTEVGDGGNETLSIAADPTSYPVTISGGGAATILYVVGGMKVAYWYGHVVDDPVTIIANDANDVTVGLTISGFCWTNAGTGYLRRIAYHETSPVYIGSYASYTLVPGGTDYDLSLAPSWNDVVLRCNADGSVEIVPSEDAVNYYIGLHLMWI